MGRGDSPMPRVRIPVRLTDTFAAADDRTLLARFAGDRDETAFATIVRRHARMVYGVCKRAVRDEHLAEDAFQAVFLVLARDATDRVAASSVGGWLFGIARRIGLAARRHEDRRLRRDLGRGTEFSRSPESTFDDLLEVLDEELAKLPEEYRAPLIACFLEERTLDEAAKHLGWSLSTLRRRLDRGKELLRVRLTRRGATLASGLLAGTLAPSVQAAVPARLLRGAVEPSPLAKSLAAETVRSLVGIKLVLATVALVTLGGLGLALTSRVDGSTPHVPPSQPVAPSVSPAPRFVERTPWVTVTGRVVFPSERAIPPQRFVAESAIKDLEFFGGATEGDVVIDPRTRGLANAVVWLRPDTDDKKAAFPVDKIHPALGAAQSQDHSVFMSAGGFTPRVIAARAGDRVAFRNATPVAFNVNYHEGVAQLERPEGDARTFNVLLPNGATHTTSRLPALTGCDSFRDNIHPWVRGYVWAFDHPYFAVTDANGNFTIPNAPAGTWRLTVWHEKAGYRNGAAGRLGEPIAIGGNGKAQLGEVVHASPGWND
ncbi:MAG: hypothetical protein C0467_23970 [Planctomycetaceae bacterium]|nr:hypothetical protein [Planctomycetaceae bacterium]